MPLKHTITNWPSSLQAALSTWTSSAQGSRRVSLPSTGAIKTALHGGEVLVVDDLPCLPEVCLARGGVDLTDEELMSPVGDRGKPWEGTVSRGRSRTASVAGGRPDRLRRITGRYRFHSWSRTEQSLPWGVTMPVSTPL